MENKNQINLLNKLSYKILRKLHTTPSISSIIHSIYHKLFQYRVIRLPRILIYNLEISPPTFGDFVHVLSTAQALSLKYNKTSISQVIIIYNKNYNYHQNFINNVCKPITSLLSQKILFNYYTKEEIYHDKLELGYSIFPYFPRFYKLEDKYRYWKPIDVFLIAKLIDLRVFEKIDLDRFKHSKYNSIQKELKFIKDSSYFCFVLRENIDKNQGVEEKFFSKKKWNPEKSIKVIKNLINKGEKIVIINPLNKKHKILGTFEIEEATYDPLLRYFIYLNAKKVFCVASGPASLLIHSKYTNYLIYDHLNLHNAEDEIFLKKNYRISSNIDWVFDAPNRQSIGGEIPLDDIMKK